MAAWLLSAITGRQQVQQTARLFDICMHCDVITQKILRTIDCMFKYGLWRHA